MNTIRGTLPSLLETPLTYPLCPAKSPCQAGTAHTTDFRLAAPARSETLLLQSR